MMKDEKKDEKPAKKTNNNSNGNKKPGKDLFQQLFGSKMGKGGGDRNRLIIIAAITLGFFLVLQFLVFPEIEINRMSYSQFYDMVERNPQTGEILSAELVENTVRGKLIDGSYFQVNVPPTDIELVPILRRSKTSAYLQGQET